MENQSMSFINYKWIILIVSTLIVFGSLGLARFGYSIVLPAMQIGLKINNTQAGMLATANLIGYLALSVIGGALAARFGPRIVIGIGLAISGLGMIFTGASNDLYIAGLWRFITGIGSGASNVPVMGLLSAWFITQQRGLASGIAVSGSSIALILLGPIVPIILSTYNESGWRLCWFIFGGINIILAVLGLIFLRNNNKQKTNTEQKQNIKLFNWNAVYTSAKVWYLGLIYFAFGFSYMIYMTFFVKSLIAEGGYSQESASRLFMIIGWFSLLCGLIWGTLSDIIGRKLALIIVYLIHAVSFSTFALLPNPIGFTISAILFGITAWSIPAIMAATCGDVLGARLAPAALGFITLFFGVGQAIAPSIAGFIADTYGSFLSAFLLAGSVSVLGALGSSFIRFQIQASNE